MDYGPTTPRRQREMDVDSDSSESDKDPQCDLFSPSLLQSYDPRGDQPAVEEDY